MWRWCCLLLAAGCVLAEERDEERRSKLPFVADAVGNTLPPPSNGPGIVGSPSNLLTPDRYEFYTFDDSGELVKRLMTLEEIQAIVAAGEGTDGHLVTFANEDQPTISFNFSQAPFTKVHSVVTNVQNVLKAQMEAQKNNPPIHPSLDTPDVSDSWSLILPTIFGNTGAEIMPDKSLTTHNVPDTETVDLGNVNMDENENENSLSKENTNNIISGMSTSKYDSTTEDRFEIIQNMEPSSTTTTTTTKKPTTTSTTTTTARPRTTSTTTASPRTSTTVKVNTRKPSPPSSTTYKQTTTTSTTTTTARPRTTTTTLKSRTTSTTTTSKPASTTTTTTSTTTTPKPRTTSTSTTTTPKPRTTSTSTTTTPKPRTTSSSTTTTPKPRITSTSTTTTAKPRISTTANPKLTSSTKEQLFHTTSPLKITNTPSLQTKTTESPNDDSLSNFVQVSTVTRGTTEKILSKYTDIPKTTPYFASTTKRYVTITRATTSAPTTSINAHSLVTTHKVPTGASDDASSTPKYQEYEKLENTTTITTQSVSPSTTVSSTEFMSIDHKKPSLPNDNQFDSIMPLFDVAQSMSQIVSDLGNYQTPTNNNLLDINMNKINEMNAESKENVEIEIPVETKNLSTATTQSSVHDKEELAFVKISTLDPTENETNKKKDTENKEIPIIKITTTPLAETISTTGTTIDPILSESMDDLLSQVVHQNPQTILSNENKVYSLNITTVNTVKQDYVTKNSSENKETTSSSNNNAEKDSNDIDQINKVVSSVAKIDTNVTDMLTEVSENNNGIKSGQISNIANEESATLLQNTSSDTTIVQNEGDKELKIIPFEKEHIKHSQDQVNKENSVNTQPKIENNMATTTKIETKKNETNDILHDNVKNITNDEIKGHVVLTQTKEGDNVKNSNNQKLKEQTDTPKMEEFKKKIQKVNIDDKELANDRNSSWKLIPTVSPPKTNEVINDNHNQDNSHSPDPEDGHKDIDLDVSKENQGLEVTTKDLGEDIAVFTELCNELAFRYWNEIIKSIDKKRSFVLSPYSITSMLAMMFMGARGATSGEMNEILKLDDMVTFNPHFTLKNISDSIETSPESGVIVSAFVRELYSDRNRGKILTFYKERAQHFYSGHVEEVNFKLISDIIRRRTNLLVKRHTWGRITEYMKSNSITMQPPLAAFSTNIFQTDCTGSSVDGRDGEMYFVVSPTVRQRRLVPVPAVVYRKGFLAGYDPVLDATAAALGNTNSIVSTLFLMPGQQGNVVHADDLEQLEKRLLATNPTTPVWSNLLRTLLPRIGLELQIPRFSHRSIFNVSDTLKKMGLKDLFDQEHADLGGLIGLTKELYLSDMVQLTTFTTCGEGHIADQHHIEEYPEKLESTRKRRTSRWATGWDEPRDYQRSFHDPHDLGDAMNLPLHLRPRQARLPSRNAQPARLKFDRPFLFFVRHNPSGMILYVGRYNPRLLP